MARIPKSDVPTLAYVLFLVAIAGVMAFGMGVGIQALGEALRAAFWR